MVNNSTRLLQDWLVYVILSKSICCLSKDSYDQFLGQQLLIGIVTWGDVDNYFDINLIVSYFFFIYKKVERPPIRIKKLNFRKLMIIKKNRI